MVFIEFTQNTINMILMKVNTLGPAAIEEIVRRVDQGRIPPGQIDESVERLLRLKVKYGLFEEPTLDRETLRNRVGAPQQIETCRKLARKTALPRRAPPS